MISYLQGKVIALGENRVTVLTTGGVGYGVLINTNTVKDLAVGSDVGLHTYLAVRENGMDLYGFLSVAERNLFLKLLSVNGIGPKSALNILALGAVDDIIRAIVNKDTDYLAEAHGVGKKAAERIGVDLSGKLGETAVLGGEYPTAEKSVLADVIEGLVSLGYSRVQAVGAVKDLDSAGKASEDLMREALKRI